MRPIAEFIMRGRMQAALVVALSTVVSLFIWVGAAAVSLLLLRKGLAKSQTTLVLGLIPAVIFAGIGYFDPLMIMLSALIMAGVLRITESWQKVLLTSVCIGACSSAVLHIASPEVFTEVIAMLDSQELPAQLKQMLTQLNAEQMQQFKALLPLAMAGMFAAITQLVALLSLILARYWQAALYNPGGFAKEFHALALSPSSMAVLVVIIISPFFIVDAMMIFASAFIPLLITGVAVVHGLVGQKKSPKYWLIAMYIGLVFLPHVVAPLLMVLAVVDSLIDFRGLRSSNKTGSADGES